MLYIRTDIAQISESQLEHNLALLPEWRREQAMRFKHLEGKRSCALSYLLLCEGLNKEYGIKELPAFDYNEHGKPALKEHPDIYFSISHCKEAVACYISDHPCGIDVESMGRYRESLARYCMNETEMQRITRAESPDVEFTRLWTQKEAILKLIGTGLSDNMKDVLKNNNHTLQTTNYDSFVLTIAI